MNTVLLFCLFVSCCYAIELTYGETTNVDLSYGDNSFNVYVPSSGSPSITVKVNIETSISIYYSWGSVTTLVNYDDYDFTYGNKLTVYVSRGSGRLYFTVNSGEYGSILSAEITVKNGIFLNTGARVAICLVAAVLALVIPSIIGKIIRNSYQDIDTPDRYRVTKLSPTGIIVGGVFWFMGTIWMTVGSSLIYIAYTLLWMVILGPIFVFLSILLMGFMVVDADRQQLKMKRFTACCIPCGRSYDMNSFSVFYLGHSYGKYGRPIFRLEAKRTDGSVIALENTYSNADVSGKQLIAEKLNAFIPPENRTAAPTYPGTIAVVMSSPPYGMTPQVVPPYSGVPPPYSGPVVYPATPVPVNANIQNDLPTVTSQYLQELISPLPPDDQSSIMALFYSRPVVIQECVRDIKDTDLLRSTLTKLAKQ